MLNSKRSPQLSENRNLLEIVKGASTALFQGILDSKASTRARVAVLSSAILAGGCGGSAEINTIEDSACSPIPDCPDITFPNLPTDNQPNNFFDLSGRFRRYDPVSGEAIKVCEPIKRDFCEDGETPEIDECEVPVCENTTICDPIPSMTEFLNRNPDKAHYPTTSELAPYLDYFDNNDVDYPYIIDNTSDCLPGQDPTGDSYYSCDIIPTCPKEEQISYCDPLPRCQEGESPISCEKREGGFSGGEEMCLDFMESVDKLFWRYGLDIAPVVPVACTLVDDPNTSEKIYQPPIMKLTCLPTPECKDGEKPQEVGLTVNIDCGQWGTWSSYHPYTLSCDPILSCNTK